MRVLVVFLALSALAAAVQGDYCSDAAESIFLNELHYENAGPDVTEAVEVALPAGVDLSAITVVLYNGGTPAAATAYSTRSLSRASVTFLPDGQWKLAVMTYGTDGVQNGPNDGVAIVATCADGAQKVLQFLCYEGAATASDGPAAGLACTNLPVSEGSSTTNSSSLYLTGEGNKAADFTWTTGTSSFGAVNDEQTFSAPAGSSAGPAPNITCDSTNYTRIAAIQGNSTLVAGATPLSGSVATIGVVVGTSFGTSSRRGFWVADPRPDSDSKTSDSVFVNVGSVVLPFTPVVGDRVTISGSVGEVGGNTQITITQLARCASGVNIAPYVAELSQLPSESNVSSVLEPLEGTRVKVTAPNLRVAENYQLGRYGEILISQGDLYVPTQLIRPGPAAQAMLLNQSYIRLDDGSTRQNPDPVIYPAPQLSPSTTLRAGYSVTSGFEAIVVQVSTQSAPYYILYPVNASNIKFNSSTSPREAGAPARMAGTNVRVVAMNVLNLFLGPPYPTARGASDATEYMRQVTKTVNAISGMKPDVIGAIEVANDGYNSTSTIANLTGLLNEKLGAGTYTYIDPGYPKVGSDVITSKILYRPAVVEPIGVLAVLNRTVNSTYLDIQRPTQAQTFRVKANGANFTFVIAHLKSKGSSCRSYGDPDKGDGQGNCAGVRKNAAAAVVSWLARNPTGVNNTNILLMGDLNAYALEDAVVELTTAGYKNMIHEFVGDSAYSYVFNGRRGYLDHALASPGMAEQVLGVSEWHINAAEPTVFDYNTEYKSSNQVQTYYTPEPIRYSDHDPVIVDLCVTSSAESNASRAQCTVLAEVTNDSSADQALKSEGAAASPKPVTVYTSSHDSLETSLAIWHMIALMSLQLVVSFWLL